MLHKLYAFGADGSHSEREMRGDQVGTHAGEKYSG